MGWILRFLPPRPTGPQHAARWGWQRMPRFWAALAASARKRGSIFWSTRHCDCRLTAAGLADRVRFLGEVPWADVVRLYQVLDLFVAPARWEGFGLTPLEAMACGVPVVAARVGAFEALIAEGVTGSLVPPDNAEALTEAIRVWVDTPARRATAGTAARAHVVRNHSIEGEARALVGVYRALLGPAP